MIVRTFLWLSAAALLLWLWISSPPSIFVAVLAGLISCSLFLRKLRRTFRNNFSYGGGRIEEHARAIRGKGKPLGELAKLLSKSEVELREFVPRYRVAKIPKRSGGVRTLNIPDEATKKLQTQVLHQVLGCLKAHSSAYGFEKGKSIANNAAVHTGQALVLNLDIEDFFESTSSKRIDYYFRRVGWDAESAAILTRIVTNNGGLPQGAPTSPRLSNLVNYYLDVQLAGLAHRLSAKYTRYADDITFSLKMDDAMKIRIILNSANQILRWRGYKMHCAGKLKILRSHQRQLVTGLVVNSIVNIPRHRRRWLRAVEHHLKTGKKASLNPQQLKGWQSFQNMVRQQGA